MVRPKVIKGGQLVDTLPNPKVFKSADVLHLILVLALWRETRDMVFRGRQVTPPAPDLLQGFWILPGERLGREDAVATDWVQAACAHLRATPPMGGKYTSHCLRKGGASAAHAVGVSYDDICILGDWAPGSSTPRKHYIDLSVLADAAAGHFFAFRIRRAPAAT